MDGSQCQGCGTDWDFSLVEAVRLAEVPGYSALDGHEGELVPPSMPGLSAGSPCRNLEKVEASLGKKDGTFAADKSKTAFGKADIPKEALEACPEALRAYLGDLLFGEPNDPRNQGLYIIFENRAKERDEAARAFLHALALARPASSGAAIRPAKVNKVQKGAAWSVERNQAYTSSQAARNEVIRLEKAAELACKDIWKIAAERKRLKTAMEESMRDEEKARMSYKDVLAQLKSARAASSLEEQKMDAIRIRDESAGIAVPADSGGGEDPKPGMGLSLEQQQCIMRGVQRKFGAHASQLQEILGPLAEIFIAALQPKRLEVLSSSPAETKATVSPLDAEAMAEAEEIREDNAMSCSEILGHEMQAGEEEAWNLAAKGSKEKSGGEGLVPIEINKTAAMEAESERTAQVKRPMEETTEDIVDEFDDAFSMQEQHDLQAALAQSRADPEDQGAAAPGTKSRRTAEAPVLSGTELAAKVLEDLEAARKELEAKLGSADPAAAISASSASCSAGPAGSASLDGRYAGRRLAGS